MRNIIASLLFVMNTYGAEYQSIKCESFNGEKISVIFSIQNDQLSVTDVVKYVIGEPNTNSKITLDPFCFSIVDENGQKVDQISNANNLLICGKTGNDEFYDLNYYKDIYFRLPINVLNKNIEAFLTTASYKRIAGPTTSLSTVTYDHFEFVCSSEIINN